MDVEVRLVQGANSDESNSNKQRNFQELKDLVLSPKPGAESMEWQNVLLVERRVLRVLLTSTKALPRPSLKYASKWEEVTVEVHSNEETQTRLFEVRATNGPNQFDSYRIESYDKLCETPDFALAVLFDVENPTINLSQSDSTIVRLCDSIPSFDILVDTTDFGVFGDENLEVRSETWSRLFDPSVLRRLSVAEKSEQPKFGPKDWTRFVSSNTKKIVVGLRKKGQLGFNEVKIGQVRFDQNNVENDVVDCNVDFHDFGRYGLKLDDKVNFSWARRVLTELCKKSLVEPSQNLRMTGEEFKTFMKENRA
ncbi:MAG: hypothetical protein MHM6MM_009149 [Cercozoa sp. M6MM]